MSTTLCFSLLFLCAAPQAPTTLDQISKDHALYVEALHGEVLTITTEHRMGSDADYVYVFGPTGKLQERLEIDSSTTTQVVLSSGDGVYKVLPVNYTFVHNYSMPGARGMVVEPFAHEEVIRVTGSTNLYFRVPVGTPSMTFHASSMWSSGAIREELYDPQGTLVQAFDLPSQTYQVDHEVSAPMPGIWTCRFVVPQYDRCGAWLEGVPNYFAKTPQALFVPNFPDGEATLSADIREVVSEDARVGVNWWINPGYPPFYDLERDAVLDARFDTARLSVEWAHREPGNDNADPFSINWQGFNFQGHDSRMAAYSSDVVAAMPGAKPVLLFYWNSSVSWQSANPASWNQVQREEYAEFVLATMIHTVAPDLQTPPSSAAAYDFDYVELLNEPNLSMGSGKYLEYFEVVKTVGRRLREHPDPRINSLKIVASGIGGVWGQGARELENWVGKLIDHADEYVDGVNWHQYEYVRLEEHERYAEDIAKVKGWLATRGDGIADEEILMTETNQHGGPPTCWRRQDTFHGALWWAGMTFSALRAGADFLHFYKLVDDPPGSYNWKGMLHHQGPYDPPIFPGGPPHGRKPIFEAAAFVNAARLERVVASSCDHAEVAHLVTASADGQRTTVLLANLLGRTIRMNAEVSLPLDLRQTRYSATLSSISPAGRKSHDRKLRALPGAKGTAQLNMAFTLEPHTIYAVEFRARL